jgi:hypothetical protein
LAQVINEPSKEQEQKIIELKSQMRKLEAAREESLSSQTKLALEMQKLQIDQETMKVKILKPLKFLLTQNRMKKKRKIFLFEFYEF